MYASKLWIYDFRCFGKAVLDLQYPAKPIESPLKLPNVNLILGDNGGGKSSVLRAIAIAVLAPVLLESGFVAQRMVRRPSAPSSLLKVEGVPDGVDAGVMANRRQKRGNVEMLARFDAREKASRDRLHVENTPETPVMALLYDDFSPAFFMVGFGATRRVETSEYSESSARRSRGLRYQRVAGLFEDHVALRPLSSWFSKLSDSNRAAALKIISAVLPPGVEFQGEFDPVLEQFVFDFHGRPTPFSSLSDGYKAFIGMAGDLIGHLADVCPPHMSMDQIPGIVLIDEIDLHLHPEWQRTILPLLAGSFQKLQFICTTHSPLVASTVQKENVFVTDVAADGTATIKQIAERIYGQSAEQLLLSSYFGLQTTRPDSFQNAAEELFRRAAAGDQNAALQYLERLAAPVIAGAPSLSAAGEVIAASFRRAASSHKTAPPPKAATQRTISGASARTTKTEKVRIAATSAKRKASTTSKKSAAKAAAKKPAPKKAKAAKAPASRPIKASATRKPVARKKSRHK